jgi:hypothetical protein
MTLKAPDLGGAAHVRAAAELRGEAVHLDDADEVAVLLAEEHHRAELAGLFERRGEVAYRLVLGDLEQALLLHAPDLLLAHPPAVAVVEAEPVGPDVAAGLHDVLAELGPQGPVEDVRGGVVGLDLLPADPVYRGGHRVADGEAVALDPRPEHLVAARRHDVEDLQLAALRGDPTLVRDLPAAGGVERVLREHHRDLAGNFGRVLEATILVSTLSRS